MWSTKASATNLKASLLANVREESPGGIVSSMLTWKTAIETQEMITTNKSDFSILNKAIIDLTICPGAAPGESH